jgi:hypothetical protein
VALVSYLRSPADPEKAAARAHRRLTTFPGKPKKRGRYIAAGIFVLVVGVFAAFAVVFVSARASLTADSVALAKVGMPLGGGTIESVSIVTGPHSSPIPAELRGQTIWPQHRIPAHENVTIDVTIKRPGWIAWLAGKTQHLQLTIMTPSASLRSHYLTLRPGQPIVLRFKQPIRSIAYGSPGHLTRRALPSPRSEIRLNRTAEAGTLTVAATMRSWETAKNTLVSWFPSGGAASAVAQPAPGTTILPHTKLTFTFSKPISKALGNGHPLISPATPGSWRTVNSHQLEFQPVGYGYGLAAKVSVQLPNGVRLAGAQQTGTSTGASWTVPSGSTLRLQQMLSLLGYLPFNYRYADHGVGLTPEAQETAAIQPPPGKFEWRYPNVPSQLRSFWSPGTFGTMTKGALMAFESDHALTTDGVPGVNVWRSLITAVIEGKKSSFGYTYVSVNIASQTLHLWHSGRDVMSTAVNTGISSAPTATGTYPVFEHVPVTTMSGTNPDGSHYSDPGIQYVSYFNGGDALHAFTRAQYGFPQSLGCVEMALAPAGQVYPYTPIGTLVTVS